MGAFDKPDCIKPLEEILKELRIQWVFGYDKADFIGSISALLNDEIDPSRTVTDMLCLE